MSSIILNSKTSFQKTLYASYIETILGSMIAVSDNEKLYLLKYLDCSSISQSVNKLQNDARGKIIFKHVDFINLVQSELSLYFSGKLQKFTVPIILIGTAWQKRVWPSIINIAYGQTISYLDQAAGLGCPKSCRAIGNANRTNNIAVIVPCHRIINNNGKLGGYAGGIERKKWLIEHESLYK